MRWLVTPPAAAAAFSRRRKPGVVLRVSRRGIWYLPPAAAKRLRERGHAGKPLQEIERDPFAFEQRAGVPPHGGDAVAFVADGRRPYGGARVHRLRRALHRSRQDVGPGEHHGFARKEVAGGAAIRRNAGLVVTSPGPISSSRANANDHRHALRSFTQTRFDLLQLRFVFGQLGANGIDDLAGALLRKTSSPSCRRVSDVFRQLVAFFFESLALGFHWPVRNVDRKIEVRRGTDGAGLRNVAVRRSVTPARRCTASKIDRRRDPPFERQFRIEAEVGANPARRVTTSCRSRSRASASGSSFASRIAERAASEIDWPSRLPSRCQSSSVMKGITGCSRRRVLRRRGRIVAPVAADFLEFDVPIAEIVVDEVPDGLRGFVVAVGVDRPVHVARAAFCRERIQRSSRRSGRFGAQGDVGSPCSGR